VRTVSTSLLIPYRRGLAYAPVQVPPASGWSSTYVPLVVGLVLLLLGLRHLLASRGASCTPPIFLRKVWLSVTPQAVRAGADHPLDLVGVGPGMRFVEVRWNNHAVVGISFVRSVGALSIGMDIGYVPIRAARRRVHDRLTVDGQEPGRDTAAKLLVLSKAPRDPSVGPIAVIRGTRCCSNSSSRASTGAN
jgi:hypothetical protein